MGNGGEKEMEWSLAQFPGLILQSSDNVVILDIKTRLAALSRKESIPLTEGSNKLTCHSYLMYPNEGMSCFGFPLFRPRE